MYLGCGFTDMRKGFDGLAAQVHTVLSLDPYGGALLPPVATCGDLAPLRHRCRSTAHTVHLDPSRRCPLQTLGQPSTRHQIGLWHRF
ncbi:IS66 family insertion sequence element accessory protein TnpB [Acidisoma cladoniae]|uniref:IS66 family insertion sequence element accessory protein TnpB n=1 Tax=Acidisoma cladoniae TaxID=3040935 RepID=UPI00254A7B18|nr:IS66 family insertion sequence element accessory protein TnpB [Acidisoma sp. PAMC 29798]